LRKHHQFEDIADLTASLGELLHNVVHEPQLTDAQRVYLGRALKDLGFYEQAVTILKAVSAPTAEHLATNPNDLTGDTRTAVLLYRGAQLELAETYRLAGNFSAAEDVLRPALDAQTGWGRTAPNFRRESLLLLEAKAAAATDLATSQKLWAEALTGWSTLAGEYRALLMKPLPTDPNAQADARRQRETVIKPLYFDAYYEVQRCVVQGNSHLLKNDPEKLGRSLDKVAESLHKVEESNPDLPEELREKFASLLAEYPELRKRYEALVSPGSAPQMP
jgi:tetratricopeptide (TPR) repeat protein